MTLHVHDHGKNNDKHIVPPILINVSSRIDRENVQSLAIVLLVSAKDDAQSPSTEEATLSEIKDNHLSVQHDTWVFDSYKMGSLVWYREGGNRESRKSLSERLQHKYNIQY